MRSNDSQKVIVVGIPKTFDDAQLSELFSEFGAVAEAKVVLDATTNASRGFGFVTFTAASTMRAAIKTMNKKVIEGRTLNVRQLVPKDQFQAQKKDEPDASKRPCWLLRKGKCTKGDKCPFSHEVTDGEFGLCFEFKQTGECKRGDKCKFSHATGDKKEEVKVEKKQPEKRVCYSFQRGRCHRGNKCLYAHELLEKDDAPKSKKEVKKEKQPFEVVDEKTEAGKKRRRDEESDDEESVPYANKQEEKPQTKPKPRKAPAAAGLAAHVNNFMSTQNKPKAQPKKFEWKAKVPASSQQVKQEQHEGVEAHEPEVHERPVKKFKKTDFDEHVQERPVKKFKKEKVDMGAAFDGVSDDETPGRKKRVVDKETLRANRAKLKAERRAKRSAKKTALSKLLTKGEVELDA